ncbi:MAG: RrF2 family transcriptional regulator [Bacilli bacterium]
MQLSKFTDYSFRVLIFTAHHQERLCTIEEIATEYNLSKNHLKKVVNNLSNLGYIDTSKGRSGGIRLAKKPCDINLGELVLQTEEHFHIAECFMCANKCKLAPDCKLIGIMKSALDAFIAEFSRKSLADLLKK